MPWEHFNDLGIQLLSLKSLQGNGEMTPEMETRVSSMGPEDPLEKGMATHSSILAWRIPWTEEPGGLQSMELKSWTRLSN